MFLFIRPDFLRERLHEKRIKGLVVNGGKDFPFREKLFVDSDLRRGDWLGHFKTSNIVTVVTIDIMAESAIINLVITVTLVTKGACGWTQA
jgi:hypothetical protein